MNKRTVEQWRTLFIDHASSGLTAAAFCREKGLDAKYFSLRKRQLNGASRGVVSTEKGAVQAASFERARVTGHVADWRVQLSNGVSVVFSGSFDVRALTQVLNTAAAIE